MTFAIGSRAGEGVQAVVIADRALGLPDRERSSHELRDHGRRRDLDRTSHSIFAGAVASSNVR
jgi:hypothetical protein